MTEIEQLEREIREKQQRLKDLKLQLPPEAVSDYELIEAGNQPVLLSQLFGSRKDLIVIHNMGKACPYCTLWADGLSGVIDHIESRAALVVVSPDSPAEQEAFAATRGWKLRMASDRTSSFTIEMGFREPEGSGGRWRPGLSTFHRAEDGRITRVATAEFGPGDVFCSVWHLFSLLADGPGGWSPRLQYPKT